MNNVELKRSKTRTKESQDFEETLRNFSASVYSVYFARRHAGQRRESTGQRVGLETTTTGQGSPRFRQTRAGSGHRAGRDGMGRGQIVSRGWRYPDTHKRATFVSVAAGATGSARSADRVRSGTDGRRSSGGQFHSGEHRSEDVEAELRSLTDRTEKSSEEHEELIFLTRSPRYII